MPIMCILNAVANVYFSSLQSASLSEIHLVAWVDLLGLPVVAPILPGVELDFFAGKCINPGMASGDAVCDVVGPLTLALGRELPDHPRL